MTSDPVHSGAQERHEPIAVNAAEAAKLVGMCRASWYSAWSAGLTPAGVKIGRARRFAVDELRQWLAAGCPARSVWTSRQATVATRDRLARLKNRKTA